MRLPTLILRGPVWLSWHTWAGRRRVGKRLTRVCPALSGVALPDSITTSAQTPGECMHQPAERVAIGAAEGAARSVQRYDSDTPTRQ